MWLSARSALSRDAGRRLPFAAGEEAFGGLDRGLRGCSGSAGRKLHHRGRRTPSGSCSIRSLNLAREGGAGHEERQHRAPRRAHAAPRGAVSGPFVGRAGGPAGDELPRSTLPCPRRNGRSLSDASARGPWSRRGPAVARRGYSWPISSTPFSTWASRSRILPRSHLRARPGPNSPSASVESSSHYSRPDLARSIDGAAIGTIHGLCRRLLAAEPSRPGSIPPSPLWRRTPGVWSRRRFPSGLEPGGGGGLRKRTGSPGLAGGRPAKAGAFSLRPVEGHGARAAPLYIEPGPTETGLLPKHSLTHAVQALDGGSPPRSWAPPSRRAWIRSSACVEWLERTRPGSQRGLQGSGILRFLPFPQDRLGRIRGWRQSEGPLPVIAVPSPRRSFERCVASSTGCLRCSMRCTRG